MVIDTSAIVAILLDETERRSFNEMIEAAERCLLSTASFVELSIVMEARAGPEGLRALDWFLDRAGIQIIPLDLEQANLARHAYGRFGKGRHTAALNMGDCFSYALAIATGEPLLFKGDDFPHTDVPVATGDTAS
ncbi:MAG: type II toxin-antitoxin system VapC family toxin [Gammaproteobacteria bacterium]|nr:type II toxin-antitoxin system VapC family toxin [Gammaproteobacteria bacterium]